MVTKCYLDSIYLTLHLTQLFQNLGRKEGIKY